MANRKLFVPINVPTPSGVKAPNSTALARRPIPVRQTKGTANFSMNHAAPNAAKLAAVDAFIDNHIPGYKQQIADATFRTIRTQFSGKGNNGNNNGNKQPKMRGRSGSLFTSPQGNVLGVFKKPGEGPSTDANYALSKAPNPKNVVLNSNVKPNTYANDYMLATVNQCSPLHMSVNVLRIPVNASVALNGYFLNTLCFDIQTRAQANIGFDLDVANQLSSAQLLTAFNAVIAALDCYYYYTSILSYESDARNKNEGMIALRAGITPTILSDLMQLGRRLEDTPLPPRMVEWVKYMNGNFLSGDNQGSAIIKRCFDMAAIQTPSNQSFCATTLATLASSANNTVFTLLRRAIPQWRIGTLYDVPPTPMYDRQFVTMFANFPSCYWEVTNKSTKTAASLTTPVGYNTFSNNLDGLAYAMTSVVVSGVSHPGLVSAPAASSATGFGDTRCSFYRTSAGATASFNEVFFYSFLAFSRAETAVVTSGVALQEVHLPAAQRCQNVCGSSLSQTGQNALDFLFDIDKIPYKGTLSHFNK